MPKLKTTIRSLPGLKHLEKTGAHVLSPPSSLACLSMFSQSPLMAIGMEHPAPEAPSWDCFSFLSTLSSRVSHQLYMDDSQTHRSSPSLSPESSYMSLHWPPLTFNPCPNVLEFLVSFKNMHTYMQDMVRM